MKSILLTSISLVCLLMSTSHQMMAQEEHHYSIIAHTESFTQEELDALKKHLKKEHHFLVPAGCYESGLILVEYPSSVALRVGTAEAMVIEVIQKLWHRGATIVKDIPREEIMSCSEKN